MFFVLSGFLITGILLDARGRDDFFRNFYVRRVLRIFPLYYGVLVFSLIILPHFHHPKLANFGRIHGDELWYWLYLSNVVIALRGAFRHGILDVSWSLAIEEQFYLVWPLVVAILSRKRLLQVCIGVIVTVWLLRLALLAAGMTPIAVYVLTPSRMDGLGAGAALAVLWRQGYLSLARRSLAIAASGAALATGALWMWRGGLDALDPVVEIVVLSLFVIQFGWVVAAAVTSSPAGAVRVAMRSRLLRSFGKYSYAMYLFHLPIRAAYRDTVFGPQQFSAWFGSQAVGQMLFFAVAIGTTWAVAWLSWNLYEKWFLALKSRFA